MSSFGPVDLYLWTQSYCVCNVMPMARCRHRVYAWSFWILQKNGSFSKNDTGKIKLFFVIVYSKFKNRVHFHESLKLIFLWKYRVWDKTNLKKCVSCVFLKCWKKACFRESVLETPKIGVFFSANLYLFSCKKGVKIWRNVLETAQNRGLILTLRMIMHYAFE